MRLAGDTTGFLEAEPGKLVIKRRESGILSISLQVGSLFKLAVMSFVSVQHQ